MELLLDNMYLRDFCNVMKRIFQPIANESNISLNVDIAEGLPEYILTDEQRVEQIVKTSFPMHLNLRPKEASLYT